MSQQALYCIVENGRENWFHAQWGANSLSPLLRLQQAYELREKIPEHPSIAEIFEHLTMDGEYREPLPPQEELFCTPVIDFLLPHYEETYRNTKEIEMKVRLDLDNNLCRMEFHPSLLLMEEYTVPIDEGLNNVKLLFASAEQKGLYGFNEIYSLYLKATGLDEAYKQAKETQAAISSVPEAQAAVRPQEPMALEPEAEGLYEP